MASCISLVFVVCLFWYFSCCVLCLTVGIWFVVLRLLFAVLVFVGSCGADCCLCWLVAAYGFCTGGFCCLAAWLVVAVWVGLLLFGLIYCSG